MSGILRIDCSVRTTRAWAENRGAQGALAMILGLLLLAGPRVALGDAGFPELFGSARRLYEAGKAEESYRAFLEAQRFTEDPCFSLWLGRSAAAASPQKAAGSVRLRS